MDSYAGQVIVGYDGSACAAAALDWAAAEAERRGLPLTVLHVRGSSNLKSGMVGAMDVPEGQHDPVNDIAVEGGARARKSAASIAITSVTQIAGPARALVESSHGAALLVVGTRGRAETTEALLGSVAFAVTAHARCPVVVVGHTPSSAAPGSSSIVVGVDGSPESEAAVRFAASAAARSALPLTIVTAYSAPTANGWAPAAPYTVESGGGPTFTSLAQEEAATATAVAARIAREEHPDLPVREIASEGRPAAVLADASAGCELLVVGSRGRGGFAGLMLGSVSHAMIHRAGCPVAVVRSEGGHDEPFQGINDIDAAAAAR